MAEEKVLILHGWEDDSKKGFIPELVKTLKEKGYSPHAIDLPNTNAPKFEEWFDSAEKEIEKIGKDNLDIVGHSMGGLLALKLAEKYKINKLILVAPVGSKPSKDYYKATTGDLSKEEFEVLEKYCERAVDAEKIKQNAKHINFIFGGKDPWIIEEIRNFYTEKFGDFAKIQTNDKYGHMSNNEDFKKLPELEKLFEKIEEKPEDKKEKEESQKAKKKEQPKVKKEEAIAKGNNLHFSKRQGVYVCEFIKNKKIDEAIKNLEQIKSFKKSVPFKGEIPHRKGKRMMSGRYPVKAATVFITMLKGLKGNALVNGLELNKTVIYHSSASWASRPARRGSRQAKRTNVILKAKEIQRYMR